MARTTLVDFRGALLRARQLCGINGIVSFDSQARGMATLIAGLFDMDPGWHSDDAEAIFQCITGNQEADTTIEALRSAGRIPAGPA